MTELNLPVAVIGAGPVGLAAAAHLLVRGETPIVFEAGDDVGHAVRQWAHVRMFSPWKYNVDKAAAALLGRHGWQHPSEEQVPTGGQLLADYLMPLASIPALRQHIHLHSRVAGVTRKGLDKVRSAGRRQRPFLIRLAGRDGCERLIEARAVIDTSGTWSSPNPAGADGLPAMNEAKASDRIFYGIPDVLAVLRTRYAGRTTTVIGSGHSALNVLIDLARLREVAPATRIVWLIRKHNVEEAFGGEAADALEARGELGIQARALLDTGAVETIAAFGVARIDRRTDGGLAITGDHVGLERTIRTDEIIVATGFRPDFSFLREIRLSIDPWLESSGTIGPLIDPNLHSCGTVRPHGAAELAHAEPDFFIAGMKSYGRAPTFLLATGHEQVRSIVAELAGDHAAALEVQLVLPETGVCRAANRVANVPASECCSGTAKADPVACCIA